ncbi:MAG: hypothetical protein NTX25_02215 [Proteobacteria bacterium]|nr:hypothetical protein [Pseudomonadota bacterium]
MWFWDILGNLLGFGLIVATIIVVVFKIAARLIPPEKDKIDITGSGVSSGELKILANAFRPIELFHKFFTEPDAPLEEISKLTKHKIFVFEKRSDKEGLFLLKETIEGGAQGTVESAMGYTAGVLLRRYRELGVHEYMIEMLTDNTFNIRLIAALCSSSDVTVGQTYVSLKNVADIKGGFVESVALALLEDAMTGNAAE